MKPAGFIIAAIGVVVVVEALKGLQHLGAHPASAAAPYAPGPGPALPDEGAPSSLPGGITPFPSNAGGRGPWSHEQCVATALAVGFDDAGARTVCNVAGHESGQPGVAVGVDTRCACCYGTADGCTSPIYHDAECVAKNLTGHCGIFQWNQTDSRFADVFQGACYQDLTCSLRWMYRFTNGGRCFADWGPDVGQRYGYCSYG